MFGFALLFVYVSSAFPSPCLGKRELVFVLIVHLFFGYANVNLATFSLHTGVRGLLRLLFVALPGLFCLPFCT